MTRTRQTKTRLAVVGALLATGIFVGDLLSPMSIAGGVPYIAVVLLSWWLPERRHVISMGMTCTILTLLGLLYAHYVGTTFSPERGVTLEAVGTRIIAIFAIWMTTILCLRQKTAEEALRESEERFSLFMKYLPGLAHMKDENLKFTYLNEPFGKTFDINVEHWLGQTVAQVFPPETAAQQDENDKYVLSKDHAVEVNEDFLQADGIHHYLTCKFPIRRPGRPTILGGVSIDITERIRAEEALKQAHSELERKVEERTADLKSTNAQLQEEIAERNRTEEALRKSEQLHAKAQQMAHLGHWEQDLIDNRAVWSKETSRIYGLELSEAQSVFRIFLDIVHPEDRPRLQAAMEAAQTLGQPMDIEYRITRPDAALRYIHATAEVRFDDEGRPFRLVGTVHDVTDRKHAEQKILNQQEELAHMSRLGTMGEMATGLAHELNQPLTSIVNYTKGCIRRVQAHAIEPEEIIAALEEVANEAGRSGEIIRRMRRFIRKHEPKRTQIEVAELIDQALGLMRHELQTQQVTIHIDINENVTSVFADRIQLQQVLLNLLRNSLDAMQKVEPVERNIKIGASIQSEDSIEIFVCDSGCGLPEEDPNKVFEPFYTSKEEGIGMGLAICRTIVESLGGQLTARANPAGGSIFKFSVPRRPSD